MPPQRPCDTASTPFNVWLVCREPLFFAIASSEKLIHLNTGLTHPTYSSVCRDQLFEMEIEKWWSVQHCLNTLQCLIGVQGTATWSGNSRVVECATLPQHPLMFEWCAGNSYLEWHLKSGGVCNTASTPFNVRMVCREQLFERQFKSGGVCSTASTPFNALIGVQGTAIWNGRVKWRSVQHCLNTLWCFDWCAGNSYLEWEGEGKPDKPLLKDKWVSDRVWGLKSVMVQSNKHRRGAWKAAARRQVSWQHGLGYIKCDGPIIQPQKGSLKGCCSKTSESATWFGVLKVWWSNQTSTEGESETLLKDEWVSTKFTCACVCVCVCVCVSVSVCLCVCLSCRVCNRWRYESPIIAPL